MVDPLLILAFATAVFAIIVTPGADMAIIVTSALSSRTTRLAAVGGILMGGMAHIGFSVAGLTAVVAAMPAALAVLGWAGAAYLVWMGIGMIRAEATAQKINPTAQIDPKEAWRRALATNLLNPKAYIFMLAVFPKFIRPDGWPVWMQASLLGALLLAIAAPIYGGIALAVTRAGSRVMSDSTASMWIHRISGATLIAIGAGMALMQLASPGT